MGLHLTQRRFQVALAVLVISGLIVSGTVLVLFSRSLSGIRGDFCAWTQAHYAATLELPQVQARKLAEGSDAALLRQLGCGKG